jgi:hypothetical protein
MTNELTLTAALAAAIAALASVVGVLWRASEKRHETLERRTESYLNVATEQMKTLVLIENHLEAQTQEYTKTITLQDIRLAEIERKIEGRNEAEMLGHAAQMRVLATIQTVLTMKGIPPAIDDRPVPPTPPAN